MWRRELLRMSTMLQQSKAIDVVPTGFYPMDTSDSLQNQCIRVLMCVCGKKSFAINLILFMLLILFRCSFFVRLSIQTSGNIRLLLTYYKRSLWRSVFGPKEKWGTSFGAHRMCACVLVWGVVYAHGQILKFDWTIFAIRPIFAYHMRVPSAFTDAVHVYIFYVCACERVFWLPLRGNSFCFELGINVALKKLKKRNKIVSQTKRIRWWVGATAAAIKK